MGHIGNSTSDSIGSDTRSRLTLGFEWPCAGLIKMQAGSSDGNRRDEFLQALRPTVVTDNMINTVLVARVFFGREECKSESASRTVKKLH